MLVSHISHMQALVTQSKSFFQQLILLVARSSLRLFHLHVRNVHQFECSDISVILFNCFFDFRGSINHINHISFLLISLQLFVQIDVEVRLLNVELYKTELLETENILVLFV